MSQTIHYYKNFHSYFLPMLASVCQRKNDVFEASKGCCGIKKILNLTSRFSIKGYGRANNNGYFEETVVKFSPLYLINFLGFTRKMRVNENLDFNNEILKILSVIDLQFC